VCRRSGVANSTHSSASTTTTTSDNNDNSGSSGGSQADCSGFVVDVVSEVLREVPVEWLVLDTRQSGRRQSGRRRLTADFAPVRLVLAGVRAASMQ